MEPGVLLGDHNPADTASTGHEVARSFLERPFRSKEVGYEHGSTGSLFHKPKAIGKGKIQSVVERHETRDPRHEIRDPRHEMVSRLPTAPATGGVRICRWAFVESGRPDRRRGTESLPTVNCQLRASSPKYLSSQAGRQVSCTRYLILATCYSLPLGPSSLSGGLRSLEVRSEPGNNPLIAIRGLVDVTGPGTGIGDEVAT